MRPVTVTVSSVTTSDPIPVNWRQAPFELSLAAVITGAATYTAELTHDAIQDSSVTPTWFPDATLDGQTVSLSGAVTSPVTAVRLNVAAVSGDVTMTILQAG